MGNRRVGFNSISPECFPPENDPAWNDRVKPARWLCEGAIPEDLDKIPDGQNDRYGACYAIRVRKQTKYKIGWAKNPLKRIKHHISAAKSTGAKGYDYFMITDWHAKAVKTESALHKALADTRTHGEFFAVKRGRIREELLKLTFVEESPTFRMYKKTEFETMLESIFPPVNPMPYTSSDMKDLLEWIVMRFAGAERRVGELEKANAKMAEALKKLGVTL